MNCCLHFQQMQFRRRFKIKRHEENRAVKPVVQTQKQFPGTKWLRLFRRHWHLPSQDAITRGVWLLWSLFPSRKLTSSAFPRPSFYTWQRTMKHTDIVQSCLTSQIPDVKATCMIQRSTPKIERDLIRVPAQVLLVEMRAQNRWACVWGQEEAWGTAGTPSRCTVLTKGWKTPNTICLDLAGSGINSDPNM